MTTLIILVILFAIAIIGLIIISIKKFSDKTDYILASNAIVSSNITDNANKILELLNTIEKLQQDNFTKIIFDIDKEVKAEASNITNLLSAIGTANKNIVDSMDVSNRALVNSINAIEKKLSTVPNSEDIIDSDELVNRIAGGLYNKMNDFQAKNSLPADKVEKPSPAKNKHRTRARKANDSYNSVQDAPQEKVNED